MKALIVLLSGLLFSVSSYANYFKGAIGYSLGGNTKFSGDSVTSETDKHDTQFLFPMLVAYGFEMTNEVYGEVEVAYRSTEYDVSNSIKPKALTAAFNVVGNVPLDAVNLTGGIGATIGQYGDLAAGFDTGTAFGVQAFGGVDFKIQDNVTLGAELRYFTTITKIDIGSGVDAEFTNTAVLFVFKSYL
jgi:opacity protein-like surface antigen